jgi:hypothetical protein
MAEGAVSNPERTSGAYAFLPNGDPGTLGGQTLISTSMAPTIQDYENIFGPAARDIKQDPERHRRRQRWHLPDVLQGPNPWLADRIDGLITDTTSSPFTTYILPYKHIDNVDGKIQWNVWSFDEGMASRVPYESSARVLTQTKRSFAGYTVRQGLAIAMEANFMMSPEGQKNFRDQLQQVIHSIQYTNNLDVHVALIQAPSYQKHVDERYFDTAKSPLQSIRDYIDLFGFVQKNPNALDIAIEEAKEILRSWGSKEPDFLLCNSKLTMQLTMFPERTQYYTQGDDGVRRLKEGPQINKYRGLKVIHSHSFSTEMGARPRDLLTRRVRTAEYYRIFMEKNFWGGRKIQLYDESRDMWSTFDLDFIIDKSGWKSTIERGETPGNKNGGSSFQVVYKKNYRFMRQASVDIRGKEKSFKPENFDGLWIVLFQEIWAHFQPTLDALIKNIDSLSPQPETVLFKWGSSTSTDQDFLAFHEKFESLLKYTNTCEILHERETTLMDFTKAFLADASKTYTLGYLRDVLIIEQENKNFLCLLQKLKCVVDEYSHGEENHCDQKGFLALMARIIYIVLLATVEEALHHSEKSLTDQNKTFALWLFAWLMQRTTPTHHRILELVIVRPNIEHNMYAVILGKGGLDDLGATLWGQTQLECYSDSVHGIWGMSYKYNERAIVFNEKNLIRLWDISYASYSGGKNCDFFDKNKTLEIADLSKPYTGPSCYAIVIDRSIYRKNTFHPQWKSPVSIGPHTQDSNKAFIPDSNLHFDIPKVLNDADDLHTKDQQFFEHIENLHARTKTPGECANENITGVYSSMFFEGSMRLLNKHGHLIHETHGSGHHGPDFVGAASKRNGKGMQTAFNSKSHGIFAAT